MMIFLSSLPRRSPSSSSSSGLINQSSMIVKKQIRYLLEVNHKPLVSIQRSNIPGAGNGVFYIGGGGGGSSSSLDKEEEEVFGHHQRQHTIPQVVCLYPGIYTPGMPKTILNYYDDYYHHYYEEEFEYIKNECYLANKLLPPSGISFDENAYIVNLPDGNGYIDGHSLEVIETETEVETTTKRRRRLLNENPSACGHLVNHCPTNHNIQLISFLWDDIIVDSDSGFDERDSDNNIITNSSSSSSRYFQLPNSIRNDGMEWYYDPIKQHIVRFPTSKTTTTTTTTTNNDHHNHDNHSSSSSSSLVRLLLRGVALVLTKPINNNGSEELLLNYGLIGPPYPNWARDWYNK